MANKMLIDATHPEETRVVVLRGNRVEEFDFETAHRKQLRGNIYLAKVTRVEPSLQAAFVDYGGNRHGFLAFSEIHPDYYQIPVADRQALLEADARADDESDDEHHRGGRRHRSRRSRRNDDSVQSDPVPAEESTSETADVTPGETATSEMFAAEPPVEGAPPAEFTPANEPAAETGARAEAPAEPPQAVAPSADPAMPPFEAAPSDQPSPAATEGNGHDANSEAKAENDADAVSASRSDNGPDGDQENGHDNGGDEEEEVVESVGGSDALEEVAERAPRYRRQYKIQEVIKRRQVMLVQVVKEERGTKGAALTTYLSLAGRYCVLMPNTARGGGISRKITSAEDRKKLREIAEDLEVPEGMGVILRTAGATRTKAEVKRDFEYLLRLWEQVRDLTLKSTAPNLVYEEGSLAKRSIRDLYTKDIDEVIVAGESGYADAKEFMRMLMPSHAKNVKLYKDTQPIFTRYGIESQLDAMFSPTVQLRSGGYIVLNQTEALVSIDVNSGRSTREHHIEDTALKTNAEAAEEIARQLRLRDLAGLIVIDFIDMDEKRNNRTVERRLKDALRHDRARIQVGRISHFGLLEMSRQRIRTSVLESSTEKCAHCGGTGHVRSVSSVSLQLLRALEEMLLKGPTHNLICRTRSEIALYVLNHKRAHLNALEQRFRVSLTVSADGEVGGQTGFVIDRGEQVMSAEQARALIAQADAPPLIVEEPEPETGDAVEEEFEAVEADGAVTEERSDTQDGDSEGDEAGHGDGQAGRGDGEGGREGGRGRRRRRRRGRGRGGEDRQQGHVPQHAGEQPPYEPPQGDPGQEQPAYATSDEFTSGERPPQSENGGQPHHENGHDDGEGGNGDRRRRRRGRRGGRRNRRDREGQGEFTGHQGAPVHERPAYNDHGDWSAPQQSSPVLDVPEPVQTPRFEHLPPPPEPVAAEPAPAPEPTPAPPRRRSTVREPAPVFASSEPVVAPMPSSLPAAEPTVVSTSAEATDKPRRTGWWAKRLLGS